MPNLQRGGGGGACLNFAHFSMQFCNPGEPKECPPKYAPDYGLFVLSCSSLLQVDKIAEKEKQFLRGHIFSRKAEVFLGPGSFRNL